MVNEPAGIRDMGMGGGDCAIIGAAKSAASAKIAFNWVVMRSKTSPSEPGLLSMRQFGYKRAERGTACNLLSVDKQHEAAALPIMPAGFVVHDR
jgi:hypothetical protein